METSLTLRKEHRNSPPVPTSLCPEPGPKKESRLTSIIDRISNRVSLQPPTSSPFIQPTPTGHSDTATGLTVNSRNSSATNSDCEESSLDSHPATGAYPIPADPAMSSSSSTITITTTVAAATTASPPCSSRSSSSNSSSSSSSVGGERRGGGSSPAARGVPVTSRGQQPPLEAARAPLLSSSARLSAATVMPADAVSLDPAAVVKSERFSPEVESSSPSVSPHSPSPARAFPGLAAFGRPPTSSAAATFPSAAERFSPALHAGSAPALKQMEMMTRNYSDFMRSLAAKYNNQNAQESMPFGGQTNGTLRGSGGISLHESPFKSSSPLHREPESRGKNSPPILLDQRLIPGSCYGNLADFSSSQTLLNLVRTASAQSASQLETYLRGAAKRSLQDDTPPHPTGRADPLDLSSKRLRMDSVAALDSIQGCRIPSPATAMRDLREALLMQGLKLDPADLLNGPLAELNAALRLSKNKVDGSVKHSKASSAVSKAVPSPQNIHTQSHDNQVNVNRCLSQCTDQSCSNKSEASELARWNVDDVVQFVASLECCTEYVEKFREQSIDGGSLALLSEDHLTSFMGMKLGPALRLRAAVARRIGHCTVCMHCVHCHRDNTSQPSASATAGPSIADSLAPSSSNNSPEETSRSPSGCK